MGWIGGLCSRSLSTGLDGKAREGGRLRVCYLAESFICIVGFLVVGLVMGDGGLCSVVMLSVHIVK
jgi:hypothetical protein